MGSSSCRVNKVPTNRIFFPAEKEIGMRELAMDLSKKLKLPITIDNDLGLYAFVADWVGVPYRFGAFTMKGTDCSGFVYQLYNQVYGKNLGRTSSHDMMLQSRPINKSDMKEGDLVFFNINNRTGGGASHVGVYLQNNLFVHASTQHGVIISNLSEPYYTKTFITAGRVSR